MNVAELVGSIGVVASYLVALPRRPVCHGVDLYGAGRPPEQLPALRSVKAHSCPQYSQWAHPGSCVQHTEDVSVGAGSEDALDHLLILRRPAPQTCQWLATPTQCRLHTTHTRVYMYIHVVLGSSSSLDSLTHSHTHSPTHSLTHSPTHPLTHSLTHLFGGIVVGENGQTTFTAELCTALYDC